MGLQQALLLSAAAVAISATASGAAAQAITTAPVDAARSDAPTSAIGEVVVTARRRAENLQDVPIAVTAYSQKDLDERHITSQVDLANNTPSLVAIQSGYPGELGGFVLRGQGPAFNGTSGTVTYFAEAPDPYLGLDGRPGSYYDLANIQVLKGPQGTLFGKNATGGNVLFEPQRPTNRYEGYIQGQVGDYNDAGVEGAINLPLVDDKVLLRVAGTAERRDGYTTDVGPYYPGKQYDNLDYYGLRVGLLLRPIDGLESYFLYRYGQSNTNGPGTVPFALNAQQPGLEAAFPNYVSGFAAQQARGIRKVSYDLNEGDNDYYSQFLNSTSYRLNDALTLKNIISYTRDYISYSYDYDGSSLPIAGQQSPGFPTEDFDYFSEELQLQGRAFNRSLQYAFGVFTDYLTTAQPERLQVIDYPLSAFLGPIPAQAHATDRSRAAFIQGTYDFSDLSHYLKGFSVTAGYRYTYEYSNSSSLVFAPPATSGEGDFHYGSYTFDLDYKLTPTTLLYASFRDAYKAGGFNSLVPAGSPFESYPPEKLTSEELGVKSSWSLFGVSGRTNLDYFFGNYQHVQREVVQDFNGIPAQVVESAAQGEVDGLEFEGVLVPIKSLELSLNYAHTTSGYTSVNSVAQGILAGAPFPYVPKNKVSLLARYQLPLSSSIGQVFVSETVTYQSRQSIAQTNQTVFPYLPGYGQLNLRLEWQHIYGRPIDLAFYATNVTDQTQVTGQFDSLVGGYGFATRTYGPPRMFGAQLKYSFGTH